AWAEWESWLRCWAHSRDQLRVRVADAGQIRGPRLSVQLAQELVVTSFLLALAHAAVRIRDVSKYDGLGRAGLRAGRGDDAVGHALLARDLGVAPGGVDALHAVGALLHDAAGAHGHVRVEGELAHLGHARLLVEVEEVEATHLVRAVVRAVPRADAAVVDHVVEAALLRVDRRRHGADVLAGGVLAVLAADRLVHDLGIAEVGGIRGVGARVVAVDADPVHRPAAAHLLGADDGDVVLRLASDHAPVAADATVEVDRHAPLLADLLVLLPQRDERRVLDHLLGEVGLALVALQIRLADDRPPLHRAVRLRGGHQQRARHRGEVRAGGRPQVLRRAQRIGVGAAALADAAGPPAAVAEGEDDHVVGQAGLDPGAGLDGAALHLHAHALRVGQAETLGRGGADQRAVGPGELRERLGDLLQPRVVGEAAVVHLGVGGEDQGHALRLRPIEPGRRAHDAGGVQLDGDEARRALQQAVVQNALPGLLAAAGGEEALTHDVVAGARPTGDVRKDLDLAASVPDGPDEGLHHRVGAVHRHRVAPLLEEVGLRDDPLHAGGGLVGRPGEVEAVFGLDDGVVEAEVDRRVVDRVSTQNDHRVHLALAEQIDRLAQTGVRRTLHRVESGRV